MMSSMVTAVVTTVMDWLMMPAVVNWCVVDWRVVEHRFMVASALVVVSCAGYTHPDEEKRSNDE